MKKSLRVKSQQDFQKVISSKKYVKSDSFVMYYYLNDEYSHFRFGISASKKLGHAVTRVQIRRQVREMIRNIYKSESINTLDYVIIVRKGYLKNNYQKNEEELRKLFKKIGGITNAKKD